MSAESPEIPDNKTLVYRGIPVEHSGTEIGRWWSTNPYYALRYANGGAGTMFVASVDNETLAKGVTDASLEDDYENYIFRTGDPEGARIVTDDEIDRLKNATVLNRIDDDFPGGTLIKWPENAVEIGRKIFLPENVGSTALLHTIEPTTVSE